MKIFTCLMLFCVLSSPVFSNGNGQENGQRNDKGNCQENSLENGQGEEAEPTLTAGNGSDCATPSTLKVNAIGIRVGYSEGIWFRRLLPMNNSLDIMLTGRNSGLQLTGLYGTHRPLAKSYVADFYWYSGLGGHIGYNRYYRPSSFTLDSIIAGPPGQSYIVLAENPRSTSVSIGFDAMVGLSYQPMRLPITVGMEIKPFLDFFNRERFMRLHLDYGFTVAYTF